jgi:FAD/FMN-containing dehydrogenase
MTSLDAPTHHRPELDAHADRPGDLTRLDDRLPGAVTRPGAAAWDQARLAWNLTADQHPAAVVHPASAAELAEVVRHAARHDRRVALQRTGHGATALASLADTLLVRTDRLTGIEVDAAARRVTVQAGALAGPLVDAAGAHDLAFLAGSSATVGVVGYTLGGGLGWLARRYGLACNTVVAAEVVTADGDLLRVDHDHEPDLFWALRGGGGSFAAVTSLEVDLVEVATVHAGALSWPLEDAERVTHAWREWIAEVPDDCTSVLRLLRYPPIPALPEAIRGRSFVSVEATFLGDEDEARPWLDRLRALAPELDTFRTQPAADLQHLHGDPEQPVPALTDHRLLREVSDEVIDALLTVAGPGAPCPLLTVDLRQLGGALHRSHPSHGVLDRLDAAAALFAVGLPVAPGLGEAIEGAFAALRAAVAPAEAATSYLNFADRPVDVATLFGGDRYDRLRAVKRAYDPQDRFLANHPVRPA